MVWVGASCRWGRARVACWRREVAGALCAARRSPAPGERLPVIVCLTWAKRAGNTYRVSFGCRNADAIAMNTPRRLCGTDAPNPRVAPADFFSVQLLHRNPGHICSFFEGEDPRPRTRTLPLPVVLGVKGLPVSLRRRRVLCTLPILQPCPPQHALHC